MQVTQLPQSRPDLAISLTHREAELLKEILFAIHWNEAEIGTFAETFADLLGDAGIDTFYGEELIYHDDGDGLEIILNSEKPSED